jgi:predicted metallopeptidase
MQHAEMADESVQLKTLQTILIVFQSRLHPESEVMIHHLVHLPSKCAECLVPGARLVTRSKPDVLRKKKIMATLLNELLTY